MARKILVVEDEALIADAVAARLRSEGYEVQSAADGPSGVEHARRWEPDLVILDLMLPGLDGLEVCRRIQKDRHLPVLMLTARDDETDLVIGLAVGADDYLTKPFSPRELVLRVQAVMRRSLGEFTVEAPFEVGEFHLDPSARIVRRHGEAVPLSGREFDLFAFFLKHPRRAFTREELLRSVWGWDFGDLSTVTVTVRRLREKTEPDPANPTRLRTVWGVGYRFDPDGAA
jgi:DNA-binding response OmpR family regulator